MHQDISQPYSEYSSLKKTALGLLAWLFLVLAFFSPSVVSDKIIAPLDCLECLFRPTAHQPIENTHNQFIVDAVSQYIPYKLSFEQSLKQDGYMGWNPYTHNGCAAPENTMASPGDIFNLLYAFLPFWAAWDLSMILQFFTAGAGVIILLRHYKLPIWAALLAAISFAFYSQFILWMYHKWVGAMMWAPFLAWALIKFKRFTINVPAIIFMALAWRSGHLQACTFAFILVACLWVSEIWKKDGTWLPKREFWRLTLSYFLTGTIGALLSLDIFVDTIPRMDGCKDMPFHWGISNIFTLISLLVPSCFGAPQTLDVAKIFNIELFDIKFGGCTIFILATIALFNNRAPRPAKFLFVISFLLTCTPLFTYIYSRSTVIMALGMAWLAGWQLHNFIQFQYKSVYIKRIAICICCIIFIWLIGSLLISCFREQLVTLMKGMVNKATIHPTSRIAWQELRVERFFDQIVLWHWKNLIFAACMLLGLFCCYKIAPEKNNKPWIMGILAITFTELLLFSSTWITYSNKPDGDYVYNTPHWMPELKNHVKDGSLRAINPTKDRDFWCRNHFSTFGIRLSDGYETFQPKYLKPLNPNTYDPQDYAQAAVSHILVDTKWIAPEFPGWSEVMAASDFKLYANPAYRGRYYTDKENYIKENWRTCNRIHLTTPANSQTLTVLESYHKGWRAYTGSQELTITPTERHGMVIQLPDDNPGCDVQLEFHMPYRKWYYVIILLTAIGLIITVLKQKETL